MIRLIAADIDGTLLNSKSQLTARTVSAVKAAMERGVYFVLATGRPYQGVNSIVKSLGLEKMPYILYNGAMVLMGGETLYSLTIPPVTARTVVNEGHKRDSTMICWANNKLYCEKLGEKIDYYKSFSGVEPIVLPSLSDIADEGITKFVWYDDEKSTVSNFAELGKVFEKELNVHPSRVDFLEFVDIRCSKAVALQKICDDLGVDVKDSVAIGDGFNDLAMLRYAGLGVAMGNADEKVKKECDIVTGDCDSDGLAEFIEKFVLKRSS